MAQLAKSIGVAVHTIAWFTWKAKHRGSLLSASDAQDYDKAMEKIFPDLTGSLAALAAFSNAAYELAKEIAEEVYSLDERVALAAVLLLLEHDGPSAVLCTARRF